MSEITMPRLSDTMQEGTIARWLKNPGDEIKKGDILAEIETDKATMDLEAYESGTLQQILVQQGETVPIGQAVALIGSATVSQAVQAAQATQAGAASVNGAGAVAVSTPTSDKPQVATNDSHNTPTLAENRLREAVKVSPLARRMAEEYGIDLSQVQGTGPGGRIVRDDIEDFLEQPPTSTAASPAQSATIVQQAPTPVPAPVASVAVPADAQTISFSRVQSLIARRLTEAKQSIPHFYVSTEVDMTDTLAMRQRFNADTDERGVKVTVNDLIIKACALALEKFPEVNSTYKDGQFFKHQHINVGFAIDVPTGLVVPVIRDANSKGVRSIARESKALIEKARANKLTPTDLEAGTFSVSNLGMMDVSEFIAVINPPQTAILAIASTRRQYVPINDQPVVRDLMTITLSADHRLLYGATVARFLQEVKHLLQTPYSLLG